MVTLCILDGFGINEKKEGNAVALAGTPFLDELMAKYPNTQIEASGSAVGLPEGQMGNSEVGHLTIGGGRVIEQDLLHIDNQIKSGKFMTNEHLIKALSYVEQNGTDLHLIGLLSTGGIHSKMSHMFAILDAAKNYNIKNIYIHAITDGRDTAVTSGKDFIAETEQKIAGTNAKIATICGRVYAMDREKRWDRLQKAYNMYVYGEGEKFNSSKEAIETSYSRDITDEFCEPMIIDENGTFKNGDAVIFYNYRSDRARELTFALTDPNFSEFKVEKFDKLLMTPMQEYAKELSHLNTLYPPKIIEDNLSCLVSNAGMKQYHIAETTKYAHVTFFFNGGIEKQYEGEDRQLIDSYNDKNFAAHPKMRAPEITEDLLRVISSKKYDFVLVNYSNPDMIGHTGDMEAAKEAVTCCDECAYKIAMETLKQGGECIIIADHGNCEEMVDEEGNVLTKHTINPVPFILVSDKNKDVKLKKGGSLANVAPTVLELLGIAKPDTMLDSMIER
ncbi:MAG: 2,3-bisphosphoglycerate-independent phosphoglycerate mutase [Clostridia bacterium]|nr:2,3-bisphosphoglycerate-independent phosphoglycerate mutase [Clostridia bacterium]